MADSEGPPKPEQDEKGRFVAGNSGNGGRPKGSRNKLGEAFVSDLLADWEKHGVKAVETVREEKPDAYLKVIASLLPKHVDVKVSQLEEMTDDQLRHQAERILAELGPLAAFASGGDSSGAGEEEARKPLN